MTKVQEEKKSKWLIYPENDYKANWDSFMTFVLIFTCVVTPLRIALDESESVGWNMANYIIDGLFLVDIIVIFNTAYYDDDFSIVEDRGQIAKDYVTSWFLIDLVAILPFELLI